MTRDYNAHLIYSTWAYVKQTNHIVLTFIYKSVLYSGTSCLSSGFFCSIAGMICFHMSATTGETTLLKSVRSRAVVLHDDSFVEDYPVVFV